MYEDFFGTSNLRKEEEGYMKKAVGQGRVSRQGLRKGETEREREIIEVRGLQRKELSD